MGWWVDFLIIVSTPGPNITRKHHTILHQPIQAHFSSSEASKKFLVGWVGGLFDYSVYSWSKFNQGPSKFDQEGTMTNQPPGQDKDQDQELDN